MNVREKVGPAVARAQPIFIISRHAQRTEWSRGKSQKHLFCWVSFRSNLSCSFCPSDGTQKSLNIDPCRTKSFAYTSGAQLDFQCFDTSVELQQEKSQTNPSPKAHFLPSPRRLRNSIYLIKSIPCSFRSMSLQKTISIMKQRKRGRKIAGRLDFRNHSPG